jgi:hypothetical protein
MARCLKVFTRLSHQACTAQPSDIKNVDMFIVRVATCLVAKHASWASDHRLVMAAGLAQAKIWLRMRACKRL